MRVTRIILFFGVAAIIAAFVLFGWLYLPSPRQKTSQTFTPEQLALDTGESPPMAWTSRLDSPRTIHLGGSGTLRLTVSPGSAALAPDGWAHLGAGPVTDASSDYHVLLEARAEVPAAGASPSGLTSQTLVQGQPGRFEWRITPQSEGMLEGRVWLYLHLVPSDGTGSIRHPLSAQLVTIHSNTLFGYVTDQVWQVAFISLAIGLLLALPYVLLRSRTRRARGEAQSSERQS